jgi:hypothetical protein
VNALVSDSESLRARGRLTLDGTMSHNPHSDQRNRVMVLLLTVTVFAGATAFGIFIGLLLAR